MAWFKVDDRFWSHPVTSELSDAATALWIRAGSWSAMHLTDGIIPKSKLRIFGSRKRAADELVQAGLWVEHDDTYEVTNWSKYQPMKDDVEAKREATRERVNSYRSQKSATSQPEASHVPARSEPEKSEKKSTISDTENAGITGENGLGNAVTNTSSNTSPDPTRTRPIEKDLFNDVERAPYSDDFETFWKSYPRRQAKGDAWKAWSQLRKQKLLPALDVLTVAAESYGRRSTEPKYVKLPGGWLREHRWLDESEAPPRPFNPYDPVKGEKPAWKAVISDPWLG